MYAMPVGVDNFREMVSRDYYFVDKTNFIKELLDNKNKVTLITRPRRFGKTLAMRMLQEFFDINAAGRDTFKGLNISRAGEKYIQHRGKYPVIFFSLKDIATGNYQDALRDLCGKISDLYAEYGFLAESPALNEREKEYFLSVYNIADHEQYGRDKWGKSLKMLTVYLWKHYGVKTILLLDEYDAPIQHAWEDGYYEDMIRFMRQFYSEVLKGNDALEFAVLTGVLRVAKESIFSGMNNLSINSVLDNKYSAYFGFTADEVMEMAEYYGAADKYDEICQWYDGYRFGKTEIFNPWSVVNYFSNECEPRPFWVSTGSNDIIGEVLAQADEEMYNRLTSLVNGETFTTFIDTGVIYPQIKSNPSTIYSFLLVTGYLKALKTTPSFSGDFMCEVSLPNREISLVYNKEILQRLENLIPPSTAISVQEAIFSGDNARLKAQIQTLLTQSVSSFDTAGENFYHGFMLGLCALLGGAFVTSNRESGDGRYDIQLKPTQKGLPGILIELKAEKNCSDEQLKKLSETALQQINDKKYETELTTAGVRTIYKYCVAFSGKKVEVAVG